MRRLWSLNEIKKTFGLEPAQNDNFKKMWSLNEIKKIGGLDLEELDTSRRMWSREELIDLLLNLNPPYKNYALNIYRESNLENIFENAWEHSLTVDPLEISVDSEYSNPRGKAQYPNGETEGVIIPHGVTSIGERAFYGWSSNNQPLVIPNSVTSIGGAAFYKWESNNLPLIIPNSVTTIGYGSFQWWSLVSYVEIQATTPPTLQHANAFGNQNDAPIYVPDESVDAYKTATNWSILAFRIFSINDK